MSASDFKARCLRVLDEVAASGAEVVITKHGKPVAKLVPISRTTGTLRGAWKGFARIRGDIVHVDWTEEFGAGE